MELLFSLVPLKDWHTLLVCLETRTLQGLIASMGRNINHLLLKDQLREVFLKLDKSELVVYYFINNSIYNRRKKT